MVRFKHRRSSAAIQLFHNFNVFTDGSFFFYSPSCEQNQSPGPIPHGTSQWRAPHHDREFDAPPRRRHDRS
ncbi:hypothetical protein SAMCFNEI73_pC1444 (plasmid) [Sinorhizobium americanum]|uniref:Uncharacterized protein n=1 Tax=Sinorhizobium americanum TaxID=194963 RepID=A0A1L3LYJ2_9HYPH|nr:hypothetical protein SAMCFNEI73_pC1444 [Sinorhizobium americanum]